MIKIACLIIAHKNIKQVGRLVDSLKNAQIDIYAHIDKKLKLSKKDELLLSNKGCTIIPKRYSCYLDEWSIIDATLSLIHFAQNKYEYSYYALLSGQDYPIKKVSNLVTLLSKNYPHPYIDITPYNKSNWVFHKFRYTPIHQTIIKLANRTQGIIGHRIRGIKKISHMIDSFFPRKYETYRMLAKNAISIYGGSAWWILPDIVIADIQKNIAENSAIVSIFKHSMTPEETFFHTFAMRSSIANEFEINDIHERAQNCLTYANFTPPSKPFWGHPYTITSDDWTWLRERKEYFARKFDIQEDSNIFNIIDNDIK